MEVETHGLARYFGDCAVQEIPARILGGIVHHAAQVEDAFALATPGHVRRFGVIEVDRFDGLLRQANPRRSSVVESLSMFTTETNSLSD